MYIYAGIDEAGYGPMFGPLTISRTVFACPQPLPPSATPDLWQLLSAAVCKERSRPRGRIAVNDSKKLYSGGSGASEGGGGRGLRHLELGALSFAGLSGHQPATLAHWFAGGGATAPRDLTHLPWYHACDQRPWQSLPCASTVGELAVARNLLAQAAAKAGVQFLDLGTAVVLEDRFNQMTAATRSKAATSFTFVSQHLRAIWERFGSDHPHIVVDRQSGRMRYREPLTLAFPDARLAILDETAQRSVYRITSSAFTVQNSEARNSGGSESSFSALAPPTANFKSASMTITFEVDADAAHLPVALASMMAKYTRELFMQRFNHWFHERLPHIKPTAGYATDAQRFWREIQPHLANLRIDAALLKRIC